MGQKWDKIGQICYFVANHVMSRLRAFLDVIFCQILDIIYVILVDIICPTSKSQGWENIVCNNCGDLGHRRSNCPKRKVCYECKRLGHLSAECHDRPAAS